ncbi:hypothetical protein ACROYT_G038511 [Oculina patagonica]
MKGFVLSVLVSSAVIVAADALKCYICTGKGDACTKDKLEADKAKYLVTCPSGLDRCMRTWAKRNVTGIAVANSCTNDVLCDNTKMACDKFREGQCAVSCCDSDECNAGVNCFSCIGTEDECAKDKLEADKAKYVVTCPSLDDQCMKTWAKKDDKTHVVNSCASKSVCDATKKKACDDYKGGKSAVSCCNTDECNAGSAGLQAVAVKCTNDASSPFFFSVFLMTVCSVLGLALVSQE